MVLDPRSDTLFTGGLIRIVGGMKILFVHDNYPAQFGALGGALRRRGWDVRFATAWEGAAGKGAPFLPYEKGRDASSATHPYAHHLDKAVIRGQSAARSFIAARNQGYTPDIVMTHSGWGSGTFARDIWPEAKFVPYLEWWYNYPAPDSVSMGHHEDDLHRKLLQRGRNAPMAVDMAGADLCLCPTRFQASQFPAGLRDQLTIIHDGVDTTLHAPAAAPVTRAADVDLTGMDEITTFFTRGMEPHRGYPQFMRALADLQARRPGLHAIIGGKDRVAYGSRLPEGESWRRRMEAELDGRLDMSRIHYVGLQPRGEFIKVLQASHAHVYLTADFVLSWSMLDAMAIGCPMIVSDCPPVREFLDEASALPVGLHDHDALTAAIETSLDDRAGMKAKGAAARAIITSSYDANDIYAAKDRMLRELIA